jgi:hypothetical protein
VAAVRLTVRVPAALPRERWAALQAARLALHRPNSLVQPPRVDVELV